MTVVSDEVRFFILEAQCAETITGYTLCVL